MEMKNIKVLSLFDGISIARQAIANCGIEIEKYYASEIDKYAIQIAQKNFPDTIQVGSVVDLKGEDFKDIDLIIGGSPCQDLSIAGKREGLCGARSGLFWEYVRIRDEVKPKYFILENVNSMSKEAKATIIEALGVEPVMINASLVSAQNRKRLFWVGKLVGDKYEQVDIDLPEDKGILLKDILEEEVDEKYFIKLSDRYKQENINKDSIGYNPYSDQILNDKARALNIGCGSATTKNATLIKVGHLNKGGQGDRIYSEEGKSVSLSALGGGGGAKTGLYAVSQRGRNIVDGKRKDIKGSKTEQRIEIGGKDKAHTITSVQKDSMVMIVTEATKKGYAIASDGDSIDLSFPNSKTRRGRVGNKAKNIMTSQNIGVFTEGQIRKLTPIECERLQGLPDNYTEGVSNTQRYKALGNGFNCKVIEHIIKNLKLNKYGQTNKKTTNK